MDRLEKLEVRLLAEPDQKISLTDPDARSMAEHPFGSLKCWMGYTQFLTMTVPKVRTEMSLRVLASNMKRVINILGPHRLAKAITA